MDSCMHGCMDALMHGYMGALGTWTHEQQRRGVSYAQKRIHIDTLIHRYTDTLIH